MEALVAAAAAATNRRFIAHGTSVRHRDYRFA
jgi:hypothetical protein